MNDKVRKTVVACENVVNEFSSFQIVSVSVLHNLFFKTLALSPEEANRDRSLGCSSKIKFLGLQASHYSNPRISAATGRCRVQWLGIMKRMQASSHVIRRRAAGYG